jgi:hypothetical protein
MKTQALNKAEPLGGRLRLVTGKEEYQPPSLRLYNNSIIAEKRKCKWGEL